MPRSRALLILAATLTAGVVTAGAAACTSDEPARKTTTTTNLPAGDQLLRDTATEMRQVQTVRFGIETDGNLKAVPVRRADGRLTRDGKAQGTVNIDQGGTLVEFAFVIVGDKVYLKGPTGGYQSLPLAFASSVYDPSAILDPERGLAKLLATAQQARTEAREQTDGKDAYKVAAAFDPQAIGTLVPGAGAGVTGHVWVGADRKLPLRVRAQLPGQNGGAPAVVTVKFSEYDQPVSINAPS